MMRNIIASEFGMENICMYPAALVSVVIPIAIPDSRIFTQRNWRIIPSSTVHLFLHPNKPSSTSQSPHKFHLYIPKRKEGRNPWSAQHKKAKWLLVDIPAGENGKGRKEEWNHRLLAILAHTTPILPLSFL